MTNSLNWVVLPAAGVGARMGADCPKQYLKIGEYTLIEHTINQLRKLIPDAPIMVSLAKGDLVGRELLSQYGAMVHLCEGGLTRAQSVLNASKAISVIDTSNPWVWVHDAARPLLAQSDIERLQQVLLSESRGAMLAQRSTDTLKQVEDGRAVTTINRDTVWRALTPQVVRAQFLIAAYEHALGKELQLTDEASAIELMGESLAVVEADEPGIKITYPQDIHTLETRLC